MNWEMECSTQGRLARRAVAKGSNRATASFYLPSFTRRPIDAESSLASILWCSSRPRQQFTTDSVTSISTICHARASHFSSHWEISFTSATNENLGTLQKEKSNTVSNARTAPNGRPWAYTRCRRPLIALCHTPARQYPRRNYPFFSVTKHKNSRLSRTYGHRIP